MTRRISLVYRPTMLQRRVLGACALASALLVSACHRGPPVWQRTAHLEGLITSTSSLRESPDGAPTVVMQVRPVLVERREISHQQVTVTEPGDKIFIMPVGGPGVDMGSGEVQLRDPQGTVTSRPIKLESRNGALVATVNFTVEEVGVSYAMSITVTAPWPPLRVESRSFVVPRGAHLRFGVGLAMPEMTEVPIKAEARVTLQAGSGPGTVVYESHLLRPTGSADLGWSDTDVDLSRFAGQTVRLLFESARPSFLRQAGLPAPLISEPFLVVPSPRKRRRNVVLVSIDTLRADHVGTYGYGRATSPLIDRTAAAGTTFTSAFAVWPETSVSHMTLFTSLYPAVHGVSLTRNGLRPLPAWQETLAEVLSHNGYVTGAMTEDGLIGYPLGFSRGFSDYREFRKPGTMVSAAAVADEVFGTGARWLERHQRDVFFLFLHTYQVHERVARGAAYDALRAEFEKDGLHAPGGKIAAMVRNYDAAIRFTDDALTDVVRMLDELHLSEQTLLIITSDHGEEFGTHGTFGHGSNLSDFAVRVPLVFRCPRFVPAGHRSAAQVGLIDLAPTLLDLLHLPPMSQAQGHSFAGQVLGEPDPSPQPVIGELADKVRSVRYPDYKVVWHADQDGGRAEYYDLRRDPGEVTPTKGDAERIAAAVALIREHDLEAVAWRDQLAATAGKPAGRTPVLLDEKTREEMRALGYKVSSQ